MTTTNAAKAAEYSASPTTHPENTQQDSSTQDSNPTSKSMRDSNHSIDSSLTLAQKFETLNPQTKRAAEQAAEGFNGFLRNTFINMLEQGQRLNELQARMQNELGKKEGSITFKTWLNSEEWDYTRTLAKSLMTVAKKYSKLPGHLKNQLRDKLNGWSLTAIKELLSAGKDIINKFKNRPTSAAAIQQAKKEEAKKQQPVTDWTEVQAQYKNLTTQDLEAIKEIAELEARKHDRPVQIQDVEKVADEYGYKKAKQQTKATTPSEAINKTKERIANYAIRQAQLEEAFKTAPENLKDDLALQIQSCKRAIAELSKGLEAGETSSKEEISPAQTGQDPELLQRIADLEQLVETLHRQNEDLTAKNSYSEPAPSASDSTAEALEQKLKEQEEAIATLKEQNEYLQEKLDETIEIVPTKPYNPTITPPTSDVPENVALETPSILQPTKEALRTVTESNKVNDQHLKDLLKNALFTIEHLEDHEKTWERRYGKALGKISSLGSDTNIILERYRNTQMQLERLEAAVEEFKNSGYTQKPPVIGNRVLVAGPKDDKHTGFTGQLIRLEENNAVIKNEQYTATVNYEHLIHLPLPVSAD